MATYQLPAEPDVDTIWTTYAPSPGETFTTRWTRTLGGKWKHPATFGDDPMEGTWAEVVGIGHVVHDTHPELSGLPPLPWTVEVDADEDDFTVVDAHGFLVPLNDDQVKAFIVRAVNEHAKQYGTYAEAHGGAR